MVSGLFDGFKSGVFCLISERDDIIIHCGNPAQGQRAAHRLISPISNCNQPDSGAISKIQLFIPNRNYLDFGDSSIHPSD